MMVLGEALWNKTAGLCGRINAFSSDDFESRDGSTPETLIDFVNSWATDGRHLDKAWKPCSESRECRRVAEELTESCRDLTLCPK